MMAAHERATKLLYFIGVDWFFYSHFLDRAIAAKKAGYDVVVLTSLTRADSPLAAHGIRVIGIPFARRSLHPVRFFRNLRDVVRVFRAEKPDIIHQVALKPILIGSLAARWLGIKRVINAVVGLGFAFSSSTRAAKIARWFLLLFFKGIFKSSHARVVFENADDREFFVQKGWVNPDGALLIRGAGVDIKRFTPRHDGSKPPVVLLLSRMLWDKGVGEFVVAARILRAKYGNEYAQFILVGDTDEDNRGAIPREQLQAWQNDGFVQWWGYREDVALALEQASISCLPSYREGLPKSLLESLAMGLTCVATDVPGCREAVVDGVNGFLVPPRDPLALAQAIERLLSAPDLMKQFGQASRKMAVEQFSCDLINEQTLELYRSLMPPTSPTMLDGKL
jgi:glycosyltransferase involved in cell wall biosynthesis